VKRWGKYNFRPTQIWGNFFLYCNELC